MRSSWLSLACALSAAVSQSSSAALINPISQSRSVSAQARVVIFPTGESDFDSASDAAPDFGPFQSQVTANAAIGGTTASASASQSSVIGSDRISGSGSTDANSGAAVDIGEGEGVSSVSIRFEVPEDVVFQLEVVLFFQFMIPGNQRTDAWFELRGGPDDQIIASWRSVPDSFFFSDIIGGVLLAGEYDLQANAAAFAEAGDTAHGQFYFDLVVVPEPSTGLLLASGLLVLGALRRSRG